MDKLEAFFYDEGAALGVPPGLPALRAKAKKLGLRATDEELGNLSFKWRNVARFQRHRRPRHHATAPISRPGVISLDLAVYHPELQVANRGAKYFLLGVDTLSQKLAVVPCRDKKQETWEKAVAKMLEETFDGQVQTILSDRDVAIAGREFKRRIKAERGITWAHLPDRSKAVHAEGMIGDVKRRLSMALANNPRGDNRWVDRVAKIVAEHNGQAVTGTGVARKDVNKDNYLEVVAQRGKTSDPVAMLNLGAASGDSFSEEVRKKLWKYAAGQRVLVAKKSTHAEKPGGGAFHKSSVEGDYSFKSYVVDRLLMRHSADQVLVPMYKLRGLSSSVFYEGDLIPALFSEEGERAEAERAREEGAAKSKRRRRDKRRAER